MRFCGFQAMVHIRKNIDAIISEKEEEMAYVAF